MAAPAKVARPLTAEANNHAYCVSALETKKEIEWKFLELGEKLYNIKLKGMYTPGWSSWEEYLMEFHLPESTINKLMKIYEVFVLQHSVEPKKLAECGGWSSLAEIIPLVKEDTPKERVFELLDIARDQTRDDLRKTVHQEKNLKGVPCEHKNTHEVTIVYCEDCPDRWRLAQ